MVIFGLNFAGKVKAVADQAIKTRFFHIFWMPILPLGSMFIMDEDGNDVRGHKIKMNFLSLFLAYPRRYLGLAWVAFTAGFFFNDWHLESLYFALGFFAVWVVFMFFLGKAGDDEKYERILLGMTTGVFAYPEWLPKKTVKDLLESMEEAWKEDNDGADWRGAASSKFSGKDSIPLLYTLSRYDAVLEKSEMNRMRTKELLSWAEQEYPRETYLNLDFSPDPDEQADEQD